MNLSHSIVIVTGGSRGLGLAIADGLRAAGATVEAPTQAEVDVRKPDDVRACVQEVLKRHNRIDLLVNNAGFAGKKIQLEDVSDADFARCMDTNVKGVFHFLREVVPVMKKQGTGTIINIASRAGSRAHPLMPIYSASKFAVIGLTQAVARSCAEAKTDIQCISVSPGGIDTIMREELFGKENSAKQQKPEQVASMIMAYLKGDLSVSNGSDVVVVDGIVERVTSID